MKPSLLIIGLGNPGKQYEQTRHNAGFRAVDLLADHCGTGPWQEKQKFQAYICEARIVTVPVLLVKPQTYMNASGEAVRKLMDFYKVDPTSQLLILCDDVDLPLGDVRLREKGSAGTHNGLKSVIEQIGESFPRLRIGIGPKPAGADLAAWVLSVPPEEEQKKIHDVLQKIPGMVKEYVTEQPPSPRARPP